ncbi:MAG: thiamine pyrophosphate-binding protein [Granulosicoccus sp.]|nr:thiamine pyrophosphate-binding protein [Granulosicoccus sp.]
MRIYEILAKMFAREQVDTCFALLGDANMNWASSMVASGVHFVYVRDEHCAVAAAMSHARKTGNVAVATVTCGPGVTQIMTALPAAVRAKIPLVIFAGEAPLKSAWYNQEIDQSPLIEACGAAYVALHDVDSMPLAVRDGFARARSECRPIVLGVPMDLQNQSATGDPVYPVPSCDLNPASQKIPPDAGDIEHAVSLINDARNVIVLAGLGVVASDAESACRTLAEQTGALLATTLPARGLFHDDPFSIGIAGGFSTEFARECFDQVDLVVAVGTRLAQHNTDGGKLIPAEKVLHIDIDPQELCQGRVAAQFRLRADALLGISALLAKLPAHRNPQNAFRSEHVAREIRDRPADSAHFGIEEGMLDPREVVSVLDDVLPRDWEMVNSSGHCSYFFAQMPRRPQQCFFTLREFGAIGNGIAFAMGVSSARPQSPVVLFDGDGSLLMHIQELETIRRHDMPILICVMNDGAYGSEIHKLRAEGLPDHGAVFGRPDFAAIAQGFGIDAYRITDLNQLGARVEQFASSGKAQLWDFHVSDKVVSPVVRRSHH